MLDPGLSLLKIGTTKVDDVTVVWIAQELGAGEGADERDFGGACDWLGGL